MEWVFQSALDPKPELVRALSDLEPANPFYTPEYLAHRRERGERPVLLLFMGRDRPAGGCTAFITIGRLNTRLDITSRPGPFESPAFWEGLRAFCRDAAITIVSINSFGSRPTALPCLGMRMAHTLRREYLLNLGDPQPFRRMRKGHSYEIKRARKAGLRMRRARDSDACSWHVRLINASLQRRMLRGELVALIEETKSYQALLAAGAAELFQAVKAGNVVASNMILLAPRGAYNHSQGTSLAGMACGAAHFLVHEIALALRVEGKTMFNLGGAGQAGGGLEKFKTGFSADTVRVDLESADFACSNNLRGMVPFLADLLRRRLRFGPC